jgi:hypothetical protein
LNTLTQEILARRLLRDYLDMPGLSLSLAQSTRLLSADMPTCRRVLDSLIDAGCLTRTAAGTYTRDAAHRSLEAWTSYTRRLLAAAQDEPDVRPSPRPGTSSVARRQSTATELAGASDAFIKGAASCRDRDAIVFAPIRTTARSVDR